MITITKAFIHLNNINIIPLILPPKSHYMNYCHTTSIYFNKKSKNNLHPPLFVSLLHTNLVTWCGIFLSSLH